jgi:hypothetical protein
MPKTRLTTITNGAKAGFLTGFATITLLALPVVAIGHDYVGESQCESCHDAEHEALRDQINGPKGLHDPVSVWQQDPHHKAFDSLTSDWAKQAAQKASVSDPQADGSMCLKCHATGAGSANPPDPSEGVSCEACHGPAADWKGKSQHGEIDDSAEKMQAAVALGLINLRRIDMREQNCRTCHVDHRPCYRASDPKFSVNNDLRFKHWRDNIPPL